MIEEIRKRPFFRPLFLWITGILISILLPSKQLLFVPLFFVGIVLFLSFYLRKKSALNYDMRWVWGVILSYLIFSLSVLFSLRSEKEMLSEKHSGPLYEWAEAKQLDLLEKIDVLNLSDDEKTVLAALTLGYKKSMSHEIRNHFAITGVAHLLAVSGFHVGIICGFLSLFFSFLNYAKWSRWLKYIFLVSLIWLFALLAGLSASAVRAALMLTFYLTGKQLRRCTDGYNTLAAAAFCMLVFDPYILFDIGFQLSFIAVFFILILQPDLEKQIVVRNPILKIPWQWITVTVAAQIGTTPLCLYYFGQSSSLFLLTNLPLMLLSTLLIPLCLVWLLIYSDIPFYIMLQSSVEWLTHSLFSIVNVFSKIPFVSFLFRFDFVSLILSYIVIVVGFVYYKQRKPYLLLMTLFIFFLLLIWILIRKVMYIIT